MADLKSDQYEVRSAAQNELVKRGEPAVEPLMKFIREENGLAMREAIDAGYATVQDKEGESNQHMREARQHDDNLKRAMYVLTKIGKPAVVPLLASLKDESATARRYKALVIESLGEIGDQRATGPILVAMKQYSGFSYGIYHMDEYAAKALEKLSGQHFRTVKEWEDWWAENKPKEQTPTTQAPK